MANFSTLVSSHPGDIYNLDCVGQMKQPPGSNLPGKTKSKPQSNKKKPGQAHE